MFVLQIYKKNENNFIIEQVKTSVIVNSTSLKKSEKENFHL
jgi:hypothetical protein